MRRGAGATVHLGAELKRGTISTADTTLEAPTLVLRTNAGELAGIARVTAVRNGTSEPLRVSARIEQATFSGHCEKPADVKSLEGSLDLTRVDLTQSIEIGAMSGNRHLARVARGKRIARHEHRVQVGRLPVADRGGFG